MRKVLLAAVLAAAMAPLQSANAVPKSETFHIDYPVVTYPVPNDPRYNPGIMSAQCATSGVSDGSKCQKSTWARLARCLYLEQPSTAQSGRNGTVGYVFKIDATKVRGNLTDDRDNNTFDLVVTNKTVDKAGGTLISTPDVDVVFYQSLGVCQSDIEQSGVVIPVQGNGPVGFESNLVYSGSYNTYGDELGKAFPSGAYKDPSDPTVIRYANQYFAIVTIVNGVDANIRFTCKHALWNGATRDCGDGWFKQL